jgi:hypothetical protein
MDIIVSDAEKYPDFVWASLTAVEGIALKTRAGIPNRRALQEGIDQDDPEAWRALVWLLRKRAAEVAGEPVVRLSDTDFAWGSCRVQFNAAETEVIEAYVRARRRKWHAAGNHDLCDHAPGGELQNEEDQDGVAEQEVEPAEDPTAANPST